MHYAYALNFTVHAAWTSPLSRGSAVLGHDHPVAVELTQTGELIELLASTQREWMSDAPMREAQMLRDALERILHGNASLSFESFGGGDHV